MPQVTQCVGTETCGAATQPRHPFSKGHLAMSCVAWPDVIYPKPQCTGKVRWARAAWVTEPTLLASGSHIIYAFFQNLSTSRTIS